MAAVLACLLLVQSELLLLMMVGLTSFHNGTGYNQTITTTNLKCTCASQNQRHNKSTWLGLLRMQLVHLRMECGHKSMATIIITKGI